MAKDIKLTIGADVRRAQAALDALQRSGKGTATSLEREFGGLASKLNLSMASVAGAVAGLLGGISFGGVVAATVKQEAAMKQLEAAVRSTGGAAGYTAEELASMASGMQAVTTYGDEVVMEGQSILLTFTKIGRETFPAATEAMLNMSTRMGGDVKTAAVQLGKALNDPVRGVTALTKSGVQFSEEQKKTIETLVRTGQTAAAQQVILAELEVQFGGSARAARETFGGALIGLKNAFGDLLEANGGLPEAQQRLETLTKLLEDPQTKEAAAQLTGSMITGFTGLATVLTEVVAGVRFLAEEAAATMYGAADTKRLIAEIDQIENKIAQLRQKHKEGGLFGRNQDGELTFNLFSASQSSLDRQIAIQEAKLQRLRQLLASAATLEFPTIAGGSAGTGGVAGSTSGGGPVADPAALAALRAVEDNLTRYQANELQKRLLAVDDFVNRQRELLEKGGVDAEQIEARMVAVKAAAEAEKAQIVKAAEQLSNDQRAKAADEAAKKQQGQDKIDAAEATALGSRLAALRDGFRSETQVIEDEYQARVALIMEANGKMAADTADWHALELAAFKDKEDKLTDIKKKGDADRTAQNLLTANIIGGATAQLLGTMAATQDRSSKEGFRKYKAFASAQAAISTALAIVNAMATVPFVPAGLAAAVVAGAMGAVQIGQISAMEYQGARATGGRVRGGERYLVGERGPEVVEMDGDGNVIPNDQLGGRRAGHVTNVTIVHQISPGVPGTVQAELLRATPYMERIAVAAVKRAMSEGDFQRWRR